LTPIHSTQSMGVRRNSFRGYTFWVGQKYYWWHGG